VKRVYETDAYGPEADRGNFWRTTIENRTSYPVAEGEIVSDFAIIGAGYTGLSAALHLCGNNAGDVVVLDAETPGWGASGRNGGFACLGGAKQSDDVIKRRSGAVDLAEFHKAQHAAVDLVSDLLVRHHIDADIHSQGETQLAHRARDIADLREQAVQFHADYGHKAQLIERDALPDHGMSGPEFHGAMTIPIGFALNPLKFVTGLAGAAVHAGARVYANSAVTEITRQSSGYLIKTAKGRIRAKKLLLATNGYSSDDIPNWMASRYLPVQSNILVTRPVSLQEQQAQGWTSHQMCYDSRNLLHYFRLMPDGRFLFGMRGGVRSDKAALADMRTTIRQDFEAMFPAWAHIESPHIWAGLVCMSRNLTPYVGPLGDWPNAFAALAYHGNGVAMASYSGALLADLATGRKSDRPFPGLMQAPLRKFPLGRWRRSILRAAYHWYAFQDRG